MWTFLSELTGNPHSSPFMYSQGKNWNMVMRNSLFSMKVPCQFYFLSKIVWNHKWFPSFWFHFWRSLLWTRARYSSLSPPRLNFVTLPPPPGRSWEPELPLCLRTHHHFLFQHNSNWTRKWLNFTFWQDVQQIYQSQIFYNWSVGQRKFFRPLILPCFKQVKFDIRPMVAFW